MKLIAQVGSLDLNEAIELKYATDLGYDALFYYPFSFEEIKQYYLILLKQRKIK